MIEEPAELPGIGGVRSEEDWAREGLAHGSVHSDAPQHLQVAGGHQSVPSHPRLAWPGRSLEGGLVGVDDGAPGVLEDLHSFGKQDALGDERHLPAVGQPGGQFGLAEADFVFVVDEPELVVRDIDTEGL